MGREPSPGPALSLDQTRANCGRVPRIELAPPQGTGGTPILVVLLPILPCLLVAPLAIVFIGVVLPLWIASLLIVGAIWTVVLPLDLLLGALGASVLKPVRATLERALFALTHPKIPERFRRTKPQ